MTKSWATSTLLMITCGNAALAESPVRGTRLSLPIACEVGKTCFIQSYVDVDPGPGVRDYACGSATYDAHNGTDLRLNSASQSDQGVAVLASAEGTVKGTRDGMQDIFAKQLGKEALQGRECGNGVVVDHGGGWETQYCHMRRGSIAVKSGDKVQRGQRLGDVGYSGMADFAHLHLTLRHNGEIIDPFSGSAQNAECTSNSPAAHGLWDESAAKALEYVSSQFMAASFTASLPELNELERDHAETEPNAKSDQLIFFARLMNLRAGDSIRVAIKGPAGFDTEKTSQPLDHNKATYMIYAGKRRTLRSWPGGRYEGEAQLLRGGSVISEMRAETMISD